ncbi:UDP-xylose and UDP-N-acetylglucosamine transporter-like [Maniola hyperantus]|uniref:UDP-xylose and UDP-N-acetylglucosamine transporter-like n=1 Tax=Aphantopus hyperantus TaxID=2795564 RepID=UPI0015693473|nr:UDP-xylose and UDP-N-acetylglucosamine transporter-like [Maniola hyperantus]
MSYFKNMIKVFAGCCSSAFLMEIMMEKAPQSANLVTFLQFFFIALQGLLTLKSRMFNPQIPLKEYFILISLFFITSVANNYVYALHVPSTLHMIIRSASSPASMLVSWYAKKQRPRKTALIGSVIISIGVSLAMYGGAAVVEERKGNFLHWCLGVTILLTMLIVGALTGLQQEILFKKFGKHPEEMLFYTHMLPLPLFLSIYPQLRSIASDLSSTLWLILFVNIISQFYCTHSVHELATRENFTTVTFILTLRKFVSLLISTIVFKNNLTVLHIFGTGFVILGTYFYFDFFVGRKQQPVSYKDRQSSVHEKDK